MFRRLFPMRISHASLFAASPLFVSTQGRTACSHRRQRPSDLRVRFRAPALAEVPVSPGAMQGGTAVLVTALALGFPVSMLMLAKLTGSDMLGWVFGSVLLLEFAALPWIALFGPDRLLQRAWGRRSR